MAGPVRIAILANGAQARNEITRTGTTMSKLGGFAKAGIAAAGVGLLALGKSAVTAEAQFSTTMRLIGAATKAPAADMKRLNDLAIKMGADTSFSASEAADAMLELAKAGIDTKTIMGGGLQGTLTLAAAGGTDLGTAATIASNALNTFNLRGKDMAKVAAALAGGANASSASVESLGQALQQVGPGATNAGLSLQETVAALSAFDAAGIKGSDAGTSLKTMLSRLVPQTDKAANAMERANLNFVDQEGNFRSLTNIAGQLQRGLGDLSDKQRTVALNSIFGSDASRAATVLMKEGTAGVREFIKATNDQSAAQKMANARMGGTAGALERLSGSAETAKLRLGQELAPAVEWGADALGQRLVPAMETSIDAAKSVGRELRPVVSLIGDMGGVAADAAHWAADLPGPIREIGIQAGIAALALPRLTTAVGAVQTRMAAFGTTMRTAETRTAAFSSAARTAAGIGGMVALTQGAQQSNDALQALGNIGGGAMLGFSVGGPWGAAIGAGAGALKSLYDVTKDTGGAMSAAKREAQQYADSIDAIAAASGRARRAETLTMLQREEGLIPTARALGVSTTDLVSAVLGNEKAYKRINSVMGKSGELNVAQGVELQRITKFLQDQGFALGRAESRNREYTRAVKGLQQETGKVPPAIRKINRELEQTGRTRPNLGPFGQFFTSGLDDVRTKASKASQRINQVLKSTTGRARPELGPFQRFFVSAMDRSRQDASVGGLVIGRNIKEGTSKARPDLGPFRSTLSGELSATRVMALSGGTSIGNALESGIVSGFSGAANQLATNAASAVTAAVNSARRAADARSPSRKMMSLGKDMADGLAIGMTGGSARSLLSIKSGRSGTATASTSSFPDEVTLLVDGHPMRAIVRREVRRETRYHDRLDDRD